MFRVTNPTRCAASIAISTFMGVIWPPIFVFLARIIDLLFGHKAIKLFTELYIIYLEIELNKVNV